jgi:flavin-dependent dehydrogenase
MNNKVAIMGASASGLLTASLLAEKGFDVTVYEASKHIASTARTLIVTHQLEELIGPLSKNTVLNKIQRFELFANGRVAEVALKKPDLVIERTRLLNALLEKATQNGTNILLGRRFLDFKPKENDLTYRVTNNGFSNAQELSTQILIGADGAFSKVAKIGGWPRQNTASLIQAVVKLPSDMPTDTSRVWFLPEDTPYFYWLIPHSPSEGVLGLIAEDRRKGRQSLERFMKRKGLNSSAFQSAPTPVYTRWVPFHRRIGNSDIYLVGDAIAHVKSSTVGGVVTGMRGALSVVDHVLDVHKQQNRSYLRLELELHGMIRKSLNNFNQNDYVELFELLKPPTMKILSNFNRDESLKLIFHLCLRRPKLLLIGLHKYILSVLA